MKINIELIKWFIKEREAIRNGKETNDYVLKHSRFCNIHREDDKVSKWIFTNCNSIKEVLIARLINRIDLLELWRSLDKDTYKYIESTDKYTNSGAYQFYPRKDETIVDIFLSIENYSRILEDNLKNYSHLSIKDLSLRLSNIIRRPLHFYFMQVILDLGHLKYISIDMNSEPYMGPGGKPILKELDTNLELLSKELELPMYDIEHLLCEVRKYVHRTLNGIPNNRKRVV